MSTEEHSEATLTAALEQFGWTCGPDFWTRYYTDPWIFNLANAVERLAERLAEYGDRIVIVEDETP